MITREELNAKQKELNAKEKELNDIRKEFNSMKKEFLASYVKELEDKYLDKRVSFTTVNEHIRTMWNPTAYEGIVIGFVTNSFTATAVPEIAIITKTGQPSKRDRYPLRGVQDMDDIKMEIIE